MKVIHVRVDNEYKEFLEILKEENNHNSISSVIRQLIVDAHRLRRNEMQLKEMEHRIINTLSQKIDYLADMADI